MPELKNPRREKFAHNLVAGMRPEDAYAQAGFKSHAQNAHRMMKTDAVMSRVAELRAPVIESVQWDYRTRLELLRDTALAAHQDGDHRAAVAAIAESNRMEGAYRPTPKGAADANAQAAFAELLTSVVNARAALPIGAQRHALRIVNDPTDQPTEEARDAR